MGQFDLAAFVCGVLDRMGLRYFVTSSVASSYFGEPRFTNDVDVVVQLPESRLREFCFAFPTTDFYVSEEAARQAVRSHGQFNIIHPESGLKADVVVAADTRFNQSRFARATRRSPENRYEGSFASMEDIIIKKMEYYKEGGSEKHLRDIAGLLRLNPGSIDYSYIQQWSAEMGLTEIWQAILAGGSPKH